jgi:uncharacterized protein (TIGR03435 family)
LVSAGRNAWWFAGICELRLESKKGMVDFVVVDHAEKIPAGN